MKKESRNKLTNKDLKRLGIRSLYSQSLFSFERMQAPGFTAAMIPGFEKIYGEDREEIAKAMMNNMDFINTEPHMLAFLQGLVLSLEESGEDRDLIKNIKTGLFGPLAGLGDAIFWFTLLPISAAIATSFNNQGSVLGPIVFVVIWTIAAFTRIWFAKLGYKLGVSSIDILQENGAMITKIAGIVGAMVIGGLIPNYVNFTFPEDLTIAGAVSVQGIFDTILPNILPLGFVLIIYNLLTKKRMSVNVIILFVIIFSIILSFVGIL